MTLQEALRLLRMELGMTQSDLAKKLGRGFVTVNRWENGKTFPSRANALEILKAAKESDASEDCVAYLAEVLMPECKRGCSAAKYGFADIDRDFLFQLADESANALYVIDAESHSLLYANRMAEKTACRDLNEAGVAVAERSLFGMKERECYRFFGDRSAPCSFCPLKDMGSESSLSASITVPENGRRYIVRAKRSSLKGRPVYVMYLTDTTELEEERHALYELTNDIPLAVGIYRVDMQDSIERVFINKSFSQAFGIAQSAKTQYSKITDISSIHPEDREKVLAEFKSAVSGNRNIGLNVRMRVKNGEYHRVDLSSRIIKKSAGKFTLFFVFTDLDEQDAAGRNKLRNTGDDHG